MKFSPVFLPFALAGFSLAVAGCSDDGGDPTNLGGSGGLVDGTGGAATGGSGGTGPATGGSGGTGGAGTGGSSDEATGGTGGAMEEEVGPLLNTEAASLVVSPYDTTSEALAVISSNLLSKPSADEYFEQWYLVVENTGATPLCYVQAEVDFNRDGVTVTEHFGYASGFPYEVADSTLSAPCLAKGERGVVYSNGFADSDVDVPSIDEVDLILLGQIYDGAQPHPNAPTITSSAEDWRVSGTAEANGTIYNIGLDAYPYDDEGFVFDQVSDVHLDTLLDGSVWDFETVTAEQNFEEYEIYSDFIEGASTLSTKSSTPESERLLEAQQAHAKRRSELDANEQKFEQSK